MALPDILSRPAVDSRHGSAMAMMVVSSVLISFGGVLIIIAVALRAVVQLTRRQKPLQTFSGPV